MDKMKCSHLESHSMIEVCLSHGHRAEGQFRESHVFSRLKCDFKFYLVPSSKMMSSAPMFQGLQSELMRLQEHSHQVLLRLFQLFQSVALSYMIYSRIPLDL